MEFSTIKKYVENHENENQTRNFEKLPYKFYDAFIIQGLQPTLIQPGRILCTFKIPPRLLSAENTLHGGAIASLVDLIGSAVMFSSLGIPSTGVSVDINVSYLDLVHFHEEIEIEGRALRVGKSIGVVSVELRKKATGKIIAQGRHTKFIPVTSKL